jgi:type IV secretion system protein VirB10
MSVNQKIKDILPNNGSFNYKNIGIILGVIFLIISIPFIFSSGEKKEKEKSKEKIDSVMSTSQKHKELIAISEENIVKQEIERLKQEEESVLAEIQYQQNYESFEPKQAELSDEERRQIIRANALLQPNTSNLFNFEQKQQIQVANQNSELYSNLIPPGMEDDPNLQKKKAEFLKSASTDNFILLNPLINALSIYEVKAGTVIPITLQTGVNSDNPGMITGFIKEDVYDSKTGRILLIPGGSKILGKYNSNISFGQERIQAVFNRITFPNQKSINLGTMLAVDDIGQSGIYDKVDNHMDKVIGSVLISAVLGAGSALTGNDDDDNSWQSEAGAGAGEQAMAVGIRYTDKILNVQPTLTVRPGFGVGVMIDKDLILEPYQK